MSKALNQRTAAVVDPILSTHARGYRNSTFISADLFPRVSIPNRSMRTIRFGKESFRLLNTRRAPGADRKRIQYGYADDPVSLAQDSLEAVVPTEHQEEAEATRGFRHGCHLRHRCRSDHSGWNDGRRRSCNSADAGSCI
ncbi:hypothetical protein [Brucella inopinata]|uniref:hypothetical protein n=1 Tax=Brucella inopinata TaxID=1218315 RepID=UPI000871180C|nr:hypothetical protein [Brucella inopinata]SCD25106.1 hypothetical protein BR141012304_20638 [Brucella inopinata]